MKPAAAAGGAAGSGAAVGTTITIKNFAFSPAPLKATPDRQAHQPARVIRQIDAVVAAGEGQDGMAALCERVEALFDVFLSQHWPGIHVQTIGRLLRGVRGGRKNKRLPGGGRRLWR